MEPNSPPANDQGHSTNSTSIQVDWDTVPAFDQNGIILSYTVTYTAFPGGIPMTTVVSSPTTRVTLRGLEEYTNYSSLIFASTVKGDCEMVAIQSLALQTRTVSRQKLYDTYLPIIKGKMCS